MSRLLVWRIYRACCAAEAFSGEGARRFGGRWNSRGVPMVYASTSLASAAVELFVHLEPNQAPRDLVSIAAELSEGEPSQHWERDTLPAEWSSDELGPLRAKGDAWIRSQGSLAVQVPSVPISLEWNVLINPLHARIHELSIKAADPFHFDASMFQGR